jgi:hypothetical protein
MEDDSLAPNDWQDYWEYQSALEGSFAATRLKDSVIEELGSYSDILTLTDRFKEVFPSLTKLLNQARVTKVTNPQSEVYYLLGWSYELGYFGFLMYEPLKAKSAHDLHKDHSLLLENFGGVINWFGDLFDSNYFNAADYWELGYADIEAAMQSESYLNNSYYINECKDKKVIPILNLTADFVQFTQEANGDCFFYHRDSGEVWKFSHEGFTAVIEEEFGKAIRLQKVKGASEVGFYKVQDCLFSDWVERGAKAWLKAMKEMPFDESNF